MASSPQRGGDPAAVGAYDEHVDPCVRWVSAHIGSHFRGIKRDRFIKVTTSEAYISSVSSFLNDPDLRFLIAFVSGSNLTVTTEPPSGVKPRSLCFVKLIGGQVTPELLPRQVVISEMNDSLEHLCTTLARVYMPLLSNPHNQDGWSEVVSRELLTNLHAFLASTKITVGEVQGTTTLPMPSEVDPRTNTQHKDRMHLLEGCIVTWTAQIKNVLKQDPERALSMPGHPGPLVELEFWSAKAHNLNSIYQQLQSDRVRVVLRYLDSSKSTYTQPFAALCRELFHARTEANDNVRFLAPLRPWFERLEGTAELPELEDLFRPIMRCLLLVWKHSRFYNTPARLVVIMREVCNTVVRQALRYVNGPKIFDLIESESPSQAVDLLMVTLRVCGVFKSTFFDAKAQSATDNPGNSWRVQNSAIFSRLDGFLERCHDIREFANTVVEFSKLAKIEIGGTKGKTLTTSVHQVHQDFQTAVQKFQSVKYDILDVDAKGFDDDFYEFRFRIKELERRVASVLSQGFDDMPAIISRFKLLDSFEGMLQRNHIKDELERKQHALLASYSEDLAKVQAMFTDGRSRPPIAHNLPPIAGALSWCRGLLSRIKLPMEKLKALNRSLLSRDEAKEIVKAYTTLVAGLAEFEHNKIEEWGKHIEASSQEKLKLPLIKRHPTNAALLQVNFDPALVRLLREVKYFLLLGLRVPDSALAIYKKAETFRKHTGNLDLIINMHNSIQQQLLPVERPLMKQYLDKMDKSLAPGLRNLNWKSHGTDLFITESMNTVKFAAQLLSKMTDNLQTIQQLLDSWAVEPLITRRAKPVSCDAWVGLMKEQSTPKYKEIAEGGRTISKLLKDTNRRLRVSQGLADWKSYVDFVSNIVITGLREVVLVSLRYMATHLDADEITRESRSPMLEIDLDLYAGKSVMFIPTIENTENNDGLRDHVAAWVDAVFRVATLFHRLDDSSGIYLREVSQDPSVLMFLATIDRHMRKVEDHAADLQAQFRKYSHLWEADLNSVFAAFLKTAHRVPIPSMPLEETDDPLDPEIIKRQEEWVAQHEAEMEAREAAGDVAAFFGATERKLDLAAFDERVCHFRDVQTDMEQLRGSNDVGFVRINSQPIKQALATCITKWVFMHTSYLADNVRQSLEWLDTFMQEVSSGLTEEVSAAPDQRDALMDVITRIRDVRRVMDQTQAMFQPMRDTVSLLKRHGMSLDDIRVADQPMLAYLDQSQLLWDNVLNHTFKVKEAIRPHQNQMADNIKADIVRFTAKTKKFRLEFQAKAPFSTQLARTTDGAYALLDKYEEQLSALEAQAAKYAELEELFELVHSDYVELATTHEEMVQLKTAWDMSVLVDMVFDAWRLTLWADIDAEVMLDETKKLQSGVRRLSAKQRSWQVCKAVEKRLRDMATILPLVLDLRSPALQDRHWKHIMSVTHSMLEKGPDFSLDDLISMQLHKHVQDVQEVVEVANKELKIEQKLRTIEDKWNSFSLEFVQYKDMEMKVLTAPDEVVETLEDHMLQLQTMMGMGKFVEYFRSKVQHWQDTLSTVETTLMQWLLVQRKWVALESIFLSSKDIRQQLPDDSKRFEGIDQDFKDLMREAEVDPTVTGACTVDGRADRLSAMVSLLERCERALNEYLDVKKNIFPRFYFVANTALLHILSNGNDPPAIMPHLGSCFDAIADLRLVASKPPPPAPEFSPVDSDDEAPPPPEALKDTATAMIAKDGEIVDLFVKYEISGAVEQWLNQLVAVMQDTLKQELDNSMDAAAAWESDMPRETWLYSFPAQIVLLASQVHWTEESESALEEFEGGQEDAVRKYLDVCVSRLEALIRQVLTPLQKSDRVKIISLITIDVHNRDVVQRLVDERTPSPVEFLWQQQLRYYWQEDTKDVVIRICDFRSWYCYEYIGNTGRLVITPLTDRCYITLTMAMRLMLGGAPAGPAGTGKTETTKDLARGLGLPCYVFNCSDQMNYQTMADIFKGLSQTGAWGCFDEFNRIPIEVLSVVATQVETVLTAIRVLSLRGNRPQEFRSLPEGRPPAKVGFFEFMGDTLALVPTVGFFITMNPGYAGRTELPENLKALFRSCAMIRPDLALICENMLMSEGFVNARPLSIKFVTLYQLSSELLSKQPHYDWGLRAVKAVLRVAGRLRREELDTDEGAVLMRALRDFNTPKIVARDTPIFLQLVSDLFPGLDLDPKVDLPLREKTAIVCKKQGLQAEDTFLLKVEQFAELLVIRHSVMLVGPAGAGKTTVWKALASVHNMEEGKPVCVYETVNPKAVTSDELYGYMTLAKDWKDGVLSIIMRNMSKNWAPYNAKQHDKWVVLDGDIDAEWIESMNTVMDDNKVLTLVSNERIPLSDAMRMVFEIENLANATPATVSRAGILYLNASDLGWKPVAESWINSRTRDSEVAQLPNLFHKYVDTALALVRDNGLVTITPVGTMCMVQSICTLLEGLLDPDAPLAVQPAGKRGQAAAAPTSRSPEFLEHVFVFACIWAIGGALTVDKQLDSRRKFSEQWKSTFKAIKFPAKGGSVFDYCYVDKGAEGGMELVPWAQQVPEYLPVAESVFSNIVVQTVDSVRLTYLLDVCVRKRAPVLFVGPAGTGKTTLVREYFATNSDEGLQNSSINLNFYTDAFALQKQLEEPIDKRSGRIYGPPGNRRHCYFVDDLNMPQVETYGTQTPIALLRQFVDYHSWFDRANLGLKREVQDLQLLAAMNPKAGSFNILERLQRHFLTLAVQMPSTSDLQGIYHSILEAHYMSGFSNSIVRLAGPIVNATIELYQAVSSHFLPSAVKFHYNFNMRDMANIFQGLCLAQSRRYTEPLRVVRQWIHECNRVFADRLVSDKDLERFANILVDMSKKHFEFESEAMQAQPLVYVPFETRIGGVQSNVMEQDTAYVPVETMQELTDTLESRLREYNETNSAMDLVLFEQAAQHVARIARIISNPRGNALLVGVGGSGKQSLCKLASSVCGFSVFQLQVTGSFGINDLKEALKDMYRRAGVKPGEPLVFLLTDSQVVDERFLVFVNDLLSSGVIPDLFSPDEFDGIFSALRLEAKAAGITESRPEMMKFFIERVRRNLHVVLCFSPVGDTLRVRARKFPALINCTCIDWFHAWPTDALVSVASKFLADVNLGEPEVRENVAHHMSGVHTSVAAASQSFLEQQRRRNYTTPKSFLELIALYKRMLGERRALVGQQIERLQTGLSTLQRTSKDVKQLQDDLAVTMVKVEEKKAATDALLEQMGKQRGEAQQQQEVAAGEKAKADAAAQEAATIEAEASGELAVAQPALDESKAAVDCLSKASLTELKSMSKPPSGVDKVTKCVLMMLRGEKRNFSWDNAKKMMAKVDQFKTQLERFEGHTMSEELVDRLEPMIQDPMFTPEKMLAKSYAAANLCNWVVNIVKYCKIYRRVAPLMARLEAAKADKAAADEALAKVEAVVAEVEGRLAGLQANFQKATMEKAKVEAEAASCRSRLELAERLVNGLASENVRWGNEIAALKRNEITLVGDVLLASAFVSYIGGFNAQFRRQLWFEDWAPDIMSREIPMTEGIDPLTVLATDGVTAEWMNDGLPSDRKSIENGAITTTSSRWPLLIDPQLQGIKWLRAQAERSEASELVVVRLSQSGWMRAILTAVPAGHTVIVENLSEEVDAALDPILSRAYVRSGKSLLLRMGGEEVEVDPRFRMFLQTKLSNPHFKPELQAQCTLVNFIVTQKGLEEQLLAHVVGREQPVLENDMRELQQAFNMYKIQLLDLENQLLERLANAPDDILSDVALIDGLEATKKKVDDINYAVERGRDTEETIRDAREVYRPVAAEGALLYFQIILLYAINHMYQYSLDAFVAFFFKAMSSVPETEGEGEEVRVTNLIESIRLTVFTWVSRGLFEEHKLIFLCQLTFELMKTGTVGEETGFSVEHLQFLIRGPSPGDEESDIPWLPNPVWAACTSLSLVSPFETFASDLAANASRFMEWYNHVTPETEKLPLEWRELDKQPFLKLLVVRCLRPDRMPIALSQFVASTLHSGSSFTECDAALNSFQILDDTFGDTGPNTPIYFVLSPGADIVSDVDRLARKYGMEKGSSYHNISLGQGQDVVAMETLRTGAQVGHWVLLNNVHLMPRWLVELEKLLDQFALGETHQDFRLFLSSDPSKGIPVGLLSRSIKLTNEPPTGLKANLKRAFCSFSAEEVEEMDSRTRGVLFGLCHFHALMLERKKFGPKGFNMMYPFSGGDLLASAIVLRNYMESAAATPWKDLRYLFGEIMYGGHIVNDFDRELCNTYLEYFLKDALLDEMEMYPFVGEGSKYSFKAPAPTSYGRYLDHINTALTSDTPLAFGLHPNAEIGFRTDMARTLFSTIQSLQPESGASGDGAQAMQHVAAGLMQDLLEEYREKSFDMGSIRGMIDDPGPFQTVYLQECEAMNVLVREMARSLGELELGMKGELTMSARMEDLMAALYNDKVPETWAKLAYASLRSLAGWLVDLQARFEMLSEWADSPMDPPKVVWLGGFFNPQSFLTAIMQTAAQRDSLELDKLVIVTDVSKRGADEIENASRDGAYVVGLYLEGARWDLSGGVISQSQPKEMFCPMPVINCRASLPEKSRGGQMIAHVPVYKTQQRGPTYVFTAQLRTKANPQQWIMAGVVLVMEVL